MEHEERQAAAFEQWYNTEGWTYGEDYDYSKATWMAACAWLGSQIVEAFAEAFHNPGPPRLPDE